MLCYTSAECSQRKSAHDEHFLEQKLIFQYKIPIKLAKLVLHLKYPLCKREILNCTLLTL